MFISGLNCADNAHESTEHVMLRRGMTCHDAVSEDGPQWVRESSKVFVHHLIHADSVLESTNELYDYTLRLSSEMRVTGCDTSRSFLHVLRIKDLFDAQVQQSLACELGGSGSTNVVDFEQSRADSQEESSTVTFTKHV